MNKLSNNIESAEALIKYLKEKGENHHSYKFYSSKKIIDSILNTHSVFLSNGDRWNDLQDRVNFNPDDSENIRFGLCFSYSKSENVAMWMLYGKNDGAMIDFPKEILKVLLKKQSIDCGKFRNDEFIKEFSLNKSDFYIDLVDIIYYGDSKDDDKSTFYIKRSDEVEQKCKRKSINDLHFCKKTTPWQYECECRLIVTVNKSIKGINNCEVIKLSFDENQIETLMPRVFHSPNHNGDFKYEKSRLNGKIQWKI